VTKKIIFKAKDPFEAEIQPKPYPAKNNLPQWWKDIEPYFARYGNPAGKIIVEDGETNASAKKCIPMLDAMLSGYLIESYADVQVRMVTTQDGSVAPRITWRTKTNVFEPHGKSSELVQPPAGYSNMVFKYLNTWIPITPPGYSCLITPPFGHRDLPFQAIPAIVDTDKSTLELVFPMWLKEGFEGIVEKGTPIVQITPFKREDWKAEFQVQPSNAHEATQEKNFRAHLVNHYARNVWSKKSYK
jgi:hypothetical protein